MEPDVHVLTSAPARISRAHAGDHTVGPGASPRRGERVPRRGTSMQQAVNLHGLVYSRLK